MFVLLDFCSWNKKTTTWKIAEKFITFSSFIDIWTPSITYWQYCFLLSVTITNPTLNYKFLHTHLSQNNLYTWLELFLWTSLKSIDYFFMILKFRNLSQLLKYCVLSWEVVAYAFSPNTEETVAGKSVNSRPGWSTDWIPGYPGLNWESLY